MAIDYTVYLYNHFLNEKGIVPSDLFTWVTSPKHILNEYHVWGAPVCVLDTNLQ